MWERGCGRVLCRCLDPQPRSQEASLRVRHVRDLDCRCFQPSIYNILGKASDTEEQRKGFSAVSVLILDPLRAGMLPGEHSARWLDAPSICLCDRLQWQGEWKAAGSFYLFA